MYIIYTTPDHNPFRKDVIATADALDSALAYVVDNLNPVLIEVDSNYPACADGILADGRVISVEPEGFTLNA